MGFFFSFVTLALAGYVPTLFIPSKTVCKIFYFLHFAGVTLMLNALFFFVLEFCHFKIPKAVCCLALILSSLDVIIVFLLTIFSDFVVLDLVRLHGKLIFWPAEWHWYFNVHLEYRYLYILSCMCILIYKACSSPKHHRTRYLNVLALIILIAVINASVHIMKSHFDYSFLTFAVGSGVTYYSCFKYKARSILLETKSNVINSSSHLLIYFDESHECLWFNKAVKDFLGFIPNLPIYLEKQFAEWRDSSIDFDELEKDFTFQMKVPKDGNVLTFKVELFKKYDNLENYLGCYFKATDITQLLEQEKEQKRLLGLDRLTGIPNRDYFFSQVKKTIRSRSSKSYLLICSNIVDFKIYNNVFGEEAGNTVLRRNAVFVSEQETYCPAFGRISGDMFAMLLDERLYNETPFLNVITFMENEFSNAFYHLRMQIGIYKITNLNEPVSSMCEKAILAMKVAKNDFNSPISWYKEDNLNRNLDEKLVMGKFEQSLKNGEFKMFLQPQVTKDNKVLGAEALARWIDIDGNIITPDFFIPVLENNGMVTKLDRFLWEEAAKQLARWKKIGREDLHISVNISVKDFYHDDLYAVFTGLVEKYGISPDRLKLEITETAIISDTEAINALLQRLRQYGFEIELDDFGSGYSSLGVLKDISVDVIKLDMSFLRRSSETEDEKSWKILNEIARLAEILEMKTVVEGVEEAEQVEKLYSFGCRIFQGFYFSKPETVTSFEERVHII